MNTDFFYEIPVRKLCSHGNGALSASIFITILCFLYQNGYFLRDTEELRRRILEKNAVYFTYDQLQDTIHRSLEVGLFNKELYESERILTSKDIQKCYLLSYPSRSKPEIKDYNLINITEFGE